MKAWKPILLVVASMLLFALSGCVSEQEQPTQGYEVLQDQIPPELSASPDFSGEITDIRIMAVECPYIVGKGEYEAYTFVKIYYGYQSDGTWYDMPAENYPLNGIFSYRGQGGAAAALGWHIVQIGDYLLIAVENDIVDQEEKYLLTDTLGTQAQSPLDDYYYWHWSDTGAQKYGRAVSGNNGQTSVHMDFLRWQFMILDLKDLTEDYELRITRETEAGSHHRILTYDGIMSLLGENTQ